ncbi:N-acylglucosamine 2-epimerase [Mycobacterium sp. PO1]|nr:N-acylglucosamine 2-epimerase [Mycobacterium sp. PO1]GFM26741.1 N-acylglucosamine 2-epimerase [Mycobacterium sp. PO2]
MPDRLVGHVEGRTLVEDVADRDEEGGAEGEQDGDIRFRHRRPPPVVHRTLPGAIAKAWAQSGATCFNSYQERSRHGDSW